MKSRAASAYASPRLTTELSSWTSGNLVQNTFLQRMEAILRMQSNLFDGFENLSRNWLEHRQDDIRSALSTVERMETIEDVAERSSLWNDWMADRIKRWSDEASMVEQSLQARERRAGDAGARRDRKGEETQG